MGPILVGVFPAFTWRQKKNQFPKRHDFMYFISYLDDRQSPEDNWFSMLYTVVKTLENLFEFFMSYL
jgi:hypothetical protein